MRPGPGPGGVQAQAGGPVELGQRGCQLALYLTSSEKPRELKPVLRGAALPGDQDSSNRDPGNRKGPLPRHPKAPPGSGRLATPTIKVLGIPNPPPQKKPGEEDCKCRPTLCTPGH